MTTPDALRWKKSSYSGGSASDCVETAHSHQTHIRDSKRREGPVILLSNNAFKSFLEHLKQS